MQITDVNTFSALNQKQLQHVAQTLLNTIYSTPHTIRLLGDVGAGKTTFVKALANSLKVSQVITSPTFSLANVYTVIPPAHLSTLEYLQHIDVYRLPRMQAQEFLETLEDLPEIRCIEWAQNVETTQESITVTIAQNTAESRNVTIEFSDEPLPTVEQICEWQKELELPQNIIDHCRVVGALCHFVAIKLVESGKPVRVNAVYRAGLLHDLYRFVDFNKGGVTPITSSKAFKEPEIWQTIKEQHPQRSHEQVVATVLDSKGFSMLSTIVQTHGGSQVQLNTIEQKILYYADKRVKFDSIVTIHDRLEDLRNRYNNATYTIDTASMQNLLAAIEQELPDECTKQITNEMVATHAKQYDLLPLNLLQ